MGERMSEQKRKNLVILRIRGTVAINKELEYTFKLLHLNRPNHATIIERSASYLGMIQKIKDYATWGEASSDTISHLLRKRCLLVGNQKLSDDYVKENFGYDSINGLAEAIAMSTVNFRELPNIKPIFRLRPPKGGFRKHKKKPYPEGELGYRGEDINQLLKKMI